MCSTPFGYTDLTHATKTQSIAVRLGVHIKLIRVGAPENIELKFYKNGLKRSLRFSPFYCLPKRRKEERCTEKVGSDESKQVYGN